MKPEEKCVSLSTAKKLKDAGFPQDTERIYVVTIELPNGYFITNLCADDDPWGHNMYPDGNSYSAPDAQELLEAIHKHCNEVAVGWNDSGCYWMVNIGGKGAGSFVEGCGANYGDPDSDSLSESLAKAWIEYETERKRM